MNVMTLLHVHVINSKLMNSFVRQLQHYNLANENGLKFSKHKTVYVDFFYKRQPNNDPCLHLDRNQIPILKEVNF